MMKFPRRFLLEGLFESATINIIGLTLLFLARIGNFWVNWWFSADSHHEFSLFATAVIAAVLGLTLRAVTSIADDSMDRPKAIFSVVAWSWVGCVLIGMLPYLFAGVFPWSRIDNALFETISGFSTTGSTVLEILKLPVAVSSLASTYAMWRHGYHCAGSDCLAKFRSGWTSVNDCRVPGS